MLRRVVGDRLERLRVGQLGALDVVSEKPLVVLHQAIEVVVGQPRDVLRLELGDELLQRADVRDELRPVVRLACLFVGPR